MEDWLTTQTYILRESSFPPDQYNFNLDWNTHARASYLPAGAFAPDLHLLHHIYYCQSFSDFLKIVLNFTHIDFGTAQASYTRLNLAFGQLDKFCLYLNS